MRYCQTSIAAPVYDRINDKPKLVHQPGRDSLTHDAAAALREAEIVPPRQRTQDVPRAWRRSASGGRAVAELLDQLFPADPFAVMTPPNQCPSSDALVRRPKAHET